MIEVEQAVVREGRRGGGVREPIGVETGEPTLVDHLGGGGRGFGKGSKFGGVRTLESSREMVLLHELPPVGSEGRTGRVVVPSRRPIQLGSGRWGCCYLRTTVLVVVGL